MEEREKIIEILKDTLNHVNNWLTFAEAKNAALLGFNAALIAFAHEVGKNISCLVWIRITMLLAMVVIIMAFISLCPKLIKYRPSKVTLSDSDKQKSNTLFYGDIAKYNVNEYIIELYKRYLEMDISSQNISRQEIDIAQEIIINATIACKKYKLFRASFIIELGAVIMLMLVA